MSSLFDDSDDDLTLRTRRAASSEYAPERSVAEMHDSAHDREVTLNTGTVLALFFALALVCAVFFGFGYSMGRKSAQPVAGAADTGSTQAPIAAGASDAPAVSPTGKPAPGSPAAQPIPGYMTQSEANEANAKSASQHLPAAPPAPQKSVAPRTAAAVPATEAKAAPVVRTPPPAAAAVPTASANSTPNVAGSTYVQIAAVSHQEDADVLLSALKRRGYSVVQRSEPTDKLIHVQIGPFPTRKDAEGTRQKLLADGYNAFVK
jgi:cell division septation protein DedD